MWSNNRWEVVEESNQNREFRGPGDASCRMDDGNRALSRFYHSWTWWNPTEYPPPSSGILWSLDNLRHSAAGYLRAIKIQNSNNRHSTILQIAVCSLSIFKIMTKKTRHYLFLLFSGKIFDFIFFKFYNFEDVKITNSCVMQATTLNLVVKKLMIG